MTLIGAGIGFLLGLLHGMWGYFKPFGGKADCGCKEKTT
jgi:hypothetical protein